MAALSYYSKWEPFWQWESGIDDPELQSLHEAWNADYSVDLNDLFFPAADAETNYDVNNVNNGSTPFGSLNSLDQEFEFEPPFNSFNNFNYPKRHKLCTTSADELIYSSYFDPCLTMLQDYALPPPQDHFPVAEFSTGKKEEEASGLSAQSMAARQRRRRITDKTRELGKLVPGGQKMNTAEMLHSAHKYIKFMQAQVALLHFISDSLPPQEAALTFEGEEEFQKLLESPLIQEKLSSAEHCLLPRKFVEQLPPTHHHKLLPKLLELNDFDYS